MSKTIIDLDSEPGPHWLTQDRKEKGQRRLADIRRKNQKQYQDNERRLARRR
jgi:hypothetical protein